MAITIPYKIDDGDKEKWAKRILAGNAAADRVSINRHDYATVMGRIPTLFWLRVDDGDIDKMLKRAALNAT